MLKVTIELHPGGDSDQARIIEELFIWNVSGVAPVSDYEYQSTDPRKSWNPKGTIRNHLRITGVWELVRRVLEEIE